MENIWQMIKFNPNKEIKIPFKVILNDFWLSFYFLFFLQF